MTRHRPKGRRGYGKAVRARAIRLRTVDKKSVAQIRRILRGPSEKTIRRWLAEAKVRTHNPRRYPRAKIERMLERGVPRTKIRRVYGCSYKWLSDLANGKLAA